MKLLSVGNEKRIAAIPYAVTHKDVERAKRNWWAKLSLKEREKYMKAFRKYGISITIGRK